MSTPHVARVGPTGVGPPKSRAISRTLNVTSPGDFAQVLERAINSGADTIVLAGGTYRRRPRIPLRFVNASRNIKIVGSSKKGYDSATVIEGNIDFSGMENVVLESITISAFSNSEQPPIISDGTADLNVSIIDSTLIAGKGPALEIFDRMTVSLSKGVVIAGPLGGDYAPLVVSARVSEPLHRAALKATGWVTVDGTDANYNAIVIHGGVGEIYSQGASWDIKGTILLLGKHTPVADKPGLFDFGNVSVYAGRSGDLQKEVIRYARDPVTEDDPSLSTLNFSKLTVSIHSNCDDLEIIKVDDIDFAEGAALDEQYSINIRIGSLVENTSHPDAVSYGKFSNQLWTMRGETIKDGVKNRVDA